MKEICADEITKVVENLCVDACTKIGRGLVASYR